MIKYRLSHGKINEYEVLKETKKQIVFILNWFDKKIERTEEKESLEHSWHETWEDAHLRMITNQEKRIEQLERELSSRRLQLNKIKEMVKP